MTIYILVHGTNDGANTLEGDRWWQRNSEFYAMLSQRLGSGDTITPFQWSGNNSDRDRSRAGVELRRQIKALSDQKEIVVIAHSHGGNIVRYAALGRLKNVKKVVLVGTPKLIRTPKLYALTGWVLILFYLIVPAMLALGVLGFKDGYWSDGAGSTIFTGLALATLLPLYPFLRFCIVGIKRLLQRQPKTIEIMSAHDEVHLLFDRLSKEAVFSRGIADFVGPMFSLFFILTAIIIWVSYLFSNGYGVPTVMADIYSKAIPTSAFAGFMIALAIGRVAKGTIKSTQCAVAYGQDHTNKVRFRRSEDEFIDRELENKLLRISSENLGSSITKIRRLLSDPAKTIANTMSAFTWNELVHTLYFRMPETISVILDQATQMPRVSESGPRRAAQTQPHNH
ncbi:MAG: alpha/beta fold hydrolase [Pseudomonadota bacterium]